MSMYPWEVSKDTINSFFSGPYLFAALYRIYRGAYYGQGFQFCGTLPKIDNKFKANFDQLPLDVKQLILSKIWDEGKDFNKLVVKKSDLYLQLPLQFLFAQYGRLKLQTQPIISKGCGAWNGSKLKGKYYVFTYGEQNLRSQVLIPDFLSRDPYQPQSIAFGLLCI